MSDKTDFAYIRTVDFAAFDATAPDERRTQRLIDSTSGAKECQVAYIKTPSGGGSPEGMHTHESEQIFYVLSGTMQIEVDGKQFSAPPGSLVVFPQGVLHRNWNDGPEPTVHIAINSPAPQSN